jgi:cytochrome c biogenesis factor
VLIKPFVGWIWFGGLMLAVGTIVALWPSVDRRRVALEGRTQSAPEPAMAAAD